MHVDTPDLPPPEPFFGDSVTNPVAVDAAAGLPWTFGPESMAQGPYGIPRAIGERTPYQYNENTPIRKRIFEFFEVGWCRGHVAGRGWLRACQTPPAEHVPSRPAHPCSRCLAL